MDNEELKKKLSELERSTEALTIPELKCEKERLWGYYNRISEIITFKEKMAEHSKRAA